TTRRGDTDRVREHELVCAFEPLAERSDRTGIDLTLERAAERTRDRDRDRRVRRRENRLHAPYRFLERDIAVPLVERLGGCERAVDTVERRRRKPLMATLVQHEPRELSVPSERARDDVFRPGHLR